MDLRCYFGDRIMVHKFSRISNFVVFCVLQEISNERTAYAQRNATCMNGFKTGKQTALGTDQATLTFAAMYIDYLSGISVGHDDSRATQDYADAVRVIEKDVGLQAQLEHGKESPPTEHTIDLLRATFNIPNSDLDASDGALRCTSADWSCALFSRCQPQIRSNSRETAELPPNSLPYRSRRVASPCRFSSNASSCATAADIIVASARLSIYRP